MNWLTMTLPEIAAFVEANIQQFGKYEVTADDILSKLPNVTVRAFECGFALLQLSPSGNSLWFLYVNEDQRGRGLGKQYLRTILKEFADTHYLTLFCHKRLRPFYSRAGFRVVERDGDSRKMIWPAEGVHWHR